MIIAQSLWKHTDFIEDIKKSKNMRIYVPSFPGFRGDTNSNIICGKGYG